MRLDISTVLVAFLLVSRTAAGPLRLGRLGQQQPSSSPSFALLDDDSPGDGEDMFDVEPEVFDVEPEDSEGDAPRVSDPQEFPDETPSPIIVTLGPGPSDNPLEDEPEETAPPGPTEVAAPGEQPEAPTDAPEDDTCSEPSPAPADPAPTSTGLPTASGETSSEPSSTNTEASATETQTDGADVGSDVPPDGGVSFTSNFASSLTETETRSDAQVTATETAAPEASAPTNSTSDPVASDTTLTAPGEPSASLTQTKTSNSTSEPRPTEEPTPPASEAPPQNPITPTGAILPEAPTYYSNAPTSTDLASPDTMARNLKVARRYNKIFSTMTPLTACSAGQVACIGGELATCKEGGGAFVIAECAAGMACFALPLEDTRGVQVGCFEEEMARRVLDGPGEGGSTTGSLVTVTTTTVRPTVIVTVTSTEGGGPVKTPTSSAGGGDGPGETPTSSAGGGDEPEETPTPPGDIPKETSTTSRDIPKEIPTSSRDEPEESSPSTTATPGKPDEGVVTQAPSPPPPPPTTSDAPTPTSDAPISSDTLVVIDIPINAPIEDILRGDPPEDEAVATTVFVTVTVRDGAVTETVTVTATA